MAKVETMGLVDESILRQAADAFRQAGEQGLSRKGLASAMGKSLRQADRARQLLGEQGARFEKHVSGQRREVKFAMVKPAKWDDRLSPEASLALRLAGEAVSRGGGHLFREQLALFERVADQSLTHRDRTVFQNLRRNVRVLGGFIDDPTEDQTQVLRSILDAFSGAIPRELKLDYQRPMKDRSWTIQQFAPYCLTQDMFSGGTYLLGWDVIARKTLQLRISRIVGIKQTGRPAVIPNPDLLERAARFQIGGWINSDPRAPEIEVQLRLKGAQWIQSLLESQPDFPGFSIAPKGNDSAVVSFKVNHLVGVKRWVLQMGEDVEVLTPSELRADLLDTAKQMQRCYREG
jgi:predicted DNA-binding transcriptional regulator YafY